MRAYRGAVFQLTHHIQRFQESAKTLTLTLPWKDSELSHWIRTCLRKSGLKEALIRVLAVSSATEGVALVLLIRPPRKISSNIYTKGVSVETATVRKDSLRASHPQVKSNQYVGAIAAVTQTRHAKSFETFFLNQEGFVAEGTVSNFVIIKKGRAFTPPTSCGILRGVTRRLVLEAAERIGIPFMEMPIAQHDIYSADEAFLTTTLSEIVPIIEWNNRRIGDGRPSCFTKRLRTEFRKMINENDSNSTD